MSAKLAQHYITGYFMSNQRFQELQAKSVAAGSFVVDGSYTIPRTWGVYKVAVVQDGTTEQAYRLGNHPIRQHELENELGAAELVMLFSSRLDAVELKQLLNARSND
ncbi:hypothetical protein [Roseateles albus]|uniref:Uncharacterized protein n=1 Tax=Roseateles albus TaxID=2987525 RepID=A0ABT5KCX4_9BURK|nr:hypothetical protein [Roseateles albus]MDC8771774.1 hypothetical protein [Roseateles albus]